MDVAIKKQTLKYEWRVDVYRIIKTFNRKDNTNLFSLSLVKVN